MDEAEVMWGILELLGHRRVAGQITTENLAGVTFLRVNTGVEKDDAFQAVTQYYHPNSVYCFTPTSMDTALEAAQALGVPAPIEVWELPGGRVQFTPSFFPSDTGEYEEVDVYTEDTSEIDPDLDDMPF